MFHVTLLVTWIVATAANNWAVRLGFGAIAVAQFGLHCFWFGISEYTSVEIVSSIAVSVVGVFIGVSMNRFPDDGIDVTNTKSDPDNV